MRGARRSTRIHRVIRRTAVRKLIAWLEPAAAIAALMLAAVGGLPYLADYGHHHYACWGPLLPCIVNSKADLPSGIAAIWLSLAVLVGLTVLAAFHARLRTRLLLTLLLLVATVDWLGLVIVEAGIFVPVYALSAAFLLATIAAAVATQVRVQHVRLKLGLLLLAGTALLCFVTILLSGFLADPIGLGPGVATGPPHAQDSLLFAVPSGRDATGTYIGLDRFTAKELARVRQGAELRPLRFVGADSPSTAPDVVSVNPIDRDTWSAVALSSRGFCYAILSVHDRSNPTYGSTYFGRLAQPAACVGAAATPATVTDKEWPAS